MPEFELVLPCYNEARSLEPLLNRAVSAARAAGFSSSTFQLVLVENGSADDSSRVMDALKAGENGAWFRKVTVEKNRGYGFGVWQGLKTTTAPVVGWSHSDEQCDPQDAFHAYEIVHSGRASIVKGRRVGRDPRDVFVSRVFESVSRSVLGLQCGEINAQPKVFKRELLGFIKDPPLNFSFDLYCLYEASKNGFKFQEIEVRFPPRVHGFSNWSANFLGRYKTIAQTVKYIFSLAQKEGRL